MGAFCSAFCFRCGPWNRYREAQTPRIARYVRSYTQSTIQFASDDDFYLIRHVFEWHHPSRSQLDSDRSELMLGDSRLVLQTGFGSSGGGASSVPGCDAFRTGSALSLVGS